MKRILIGWLVVAILVASVLLWFFLVSRNYMPHGVAVMAIIPGALAVALARKLAQEKQQLNISRARSRRESAAKLFTRGLSLVYPFRHVRGAITSVPGANAVAIDGHDYWTLPNGLFYGARLLDNDHIHAVVRPIAILSKPLLVAVLVERSSRIYGVGLLPNWAICGLLSLSSVIDLWSNGPLHWWHFFALAWLIVMLLFTRWAIYAKRELARVFIKNSSTATS